MARSPESLAVLEGVLIEKELQCPQCGTRDDEWGEYDRNGELIEFRPAPYKTKTHTCPGCARKAGRAEEPDAKRPGTTVELVRNRP